MIMNPNSQWQFGPSLKLARGLEQVYHVALVAELLGVVHPVRMATDRLAISSTAIQARAHRGSGLGGFLLVGCLLLDPVLEFQIEPPGEPLPCTSHKIPPGGHLW